MDITPQSLNLLIHAIEGAARVLGWVIGISTTVFVALSGITVGIIFRIWNQRLTEALQRSGAAIDSATELSAMISQSSTHCQKMRAECRENLFKEIASQVKGIDSEHRILIEKAINGVQATILQHRDDLVNKLDEINAENKEYWDALHSHRHSDDGSVIRS